MIHTDIFKPENFGYKYLAVWCPDDQTEKEFVRIMTEYSVRIPHRDDIREKYGSSLCYAIRVGGYDAKYITYASREFYSQNNDSFHLVTFEEFLRIVRPCQIDIDAFCALIGD